MITCRLVRRRKKRTNAKAPTSVLGHSAIVERPFTFVRKPCFEELLILVGGSLTQFFLVIATGNRR